MGGICIRCPETGAEVETGFDAAVLEALNDVYFTLEDCPKCGHAHGWNSADAVIHAAHMVPVQRSGSSIERA